MAVMLSALQPPSLTIFSLSLLPTGLHCYTTQEEIQGSTLGPGTFKGCILLGATSRSKS